MSADAPAVVKSAAAPCPPHQPDCDPAVTYETYFRPTYRISYKTVTELEWRCCPGYQGPDCTQIKGHPYEQTRNLPQSRVRNPSHQHRRPVLNEEAQNNGHHETEKSQQLEKEVQRLSQTVLDLQAAMTGMSLNLRTNFQEDASKMFESFLNNMRLPDSVRTGGTVESVALLDGHQPTTGFAHNGENIEEVLARLNEATDALKIKDKAIEELRDAVMGHDGQIRMLMDASQGPADSISGTSDIDILHTYIDTKFEKLKKELVVDMKEQIARLKSSCDDKILALQKTWKEGQERNFDNLTKLILSKESELRKEIHEKHLDMAMSDGLVRTHRQTAPFENDHGDIRQALQRVSEAHRVLNSRVDNELKHLSMLQLEDVFGPRLDELEMRMNVTERNAETYCFYVDEKLTKELADETAKIYRLLDERFSSLEDQFTATLIEISNNSLPGVFSESNDALQTQVNANKYLIQGLEDKVHAFGQLCSNKCKTGTSTDSQNLERMDDIVNDLRQCKNDVGRLNVDVKNNAAKLNELGGRSDHLARKSEENSERIKVVNNKINPIEDNLGGLTGAVTGLGDAMSKFSQDIQTLNASCCLSSQEDLVQRLLRRPHLSHGENQPSVRQIEELRNSLERLNTQVFSELSLLKKNATNLANVLSTVDGRVAALEKLHGKLDNDANRIEAMKKILVRDLAKMNLTLHTHSIALNNLESNLLNLQSQQATLQNHTTKQQGLPVKQENFPDSKTLVPPVRKYIPQIHIPLIIPQRIPITSHPPARQPHAEPSHPRQPQVPLQPRNPHPQPNQPVLISGEAGPPGYSRRANLRRERESQYSGQPINGFAGAPGYHPVKPLGYKPHPVPVSWNPAHRLSATPVVSERNSFVEPFSFSAGLTKQTSSGDFGIIHFNRVLVNDGGHYNPETGIFTVPESGRYLVTAVLTAPHAQRIEAVLSVSERSIQKLGTAGYGGHGGPLASLPCQCGSTASINLVLALRAGDRVALVRTAGTLAVSEAREILSTFSAVFLYSPQAHR